MKPTLALLMVASCGAAFAADRYQVTLRLPSGGLFAREEMQLEFRVEDTTRPDPLGGFAPVIRAAPEAVIDMPQMSGMPKFTETAHPEDTPGDYGVHPTFAHGGEYRLTLRIHPPGGEPFEKVLSLDVADARPKPTPPRFTLELSSQPKRPKAGEPVELRLVVHDRQALATQFEIVHEKFMHLIVVRKDLGQFAHEHPEQQPDGSFRLQYTFPTGGEYHLFADIAPRGAGSQVLTGKLKIGGAEGAPFDVRRGSLSLSELPSGKTSPLTLPVPADAEPYLGAPGHLILIHEDGESFVHSHPSEESPSSGRLQFLARLPKPGLYRGWLQYMRAGKVETTELLLRAEPPK